MPGKRRRISPKEFEYMQQVSYDTARRVMLALERANNREAVGRIGVKTRRFPKGKKIFMYEDYYLQNFH
jgi:hypothetical protein